MKKEYLNPDTLFPSRQFGFSQAVTTQGGKLVHCAGQTAWDKDMNLVGEGDLPKQLQQALENVRLALEAAGAKPEDVVRIKTYVADYKAEYIEPISKAMADFFKESAPASTLIGVQSLAIPGFMVEIEVTALVPEAT
jgi:enamine deaminase RidA (YjgF/YER057c/UK114 family)